MKAILLRRAGREERFELYFRRQAPPPNEPTFDRDREIVGTRTHESARHGRVRRQDQGRHARFPSRLCQNGIETPHPIVGQSGATPPAVDRVVAAEVLLVCDNRLAKFGERQPTSPVGRLARSIVLSLQSAQLVV
jgi:hypothetical protein